MKYKVPLYQMKRKETKIGTVIITYDALGATDVVSKEKIHISSGMINYKEENWNKNIFNPYIKKSDINRLNILKETKKEPVKKKKKIIIINNNDNK